MSEVVKNAVVTGHRIEIERDCLTMMLFLDYGDGSNKGFGGIVLYQPKDWPYSSNFAGNFIYSTMKVCGVERLEDVSGKEIRVRLDCDGLGGRILAIGHITRNIWFRPREEYAQATIDMDRLAGR